jgi:hypothetical protein
VTNSAEKGITGNNTQICNTQVLGAQHLKTSTEKKPQCSLGTFQLLDISKSFPGCQFDYML